MVDKPDIINGDQRPAGAGHGRSRWRGLLSKLALATASAGLTIALLEGGISLLLSHPQWIPEDALDVLRVYYRHREWTNMQLLPGCAVYDPEVTYTLRPGSFRFATREFDNAYSANPLGLRDDEASLEGPEIIILGDSYTMGWGVEQDQTFAALLEQQTGRKVLNAGIPSFGTVREMILLQRLDTSKLTTLVIQYCANDLQENQTWAWHHKHLTISTEQQFDDLSVKHLQKRRYFFGKHLLSITRQLAHRWEHGSDSVHRIPARIPRPPNEARLFLRVLSASQFDFTGVQLVVLSLDADADNDHSFLDQLAAEKASYELPEGLQWPLTVDVSPALTKEHYYTLDTHIRPAGHAVVAELIAEALAKSE